MKKERIKINSWRRKKGEKEIGKLIRKRRKEKERKKERKKGTW